MTTRALANRQIRRRRHPPAVVLLALLATAPGSGGGYVEMEYSALLRDTPYPFQSTLVHELGHAFGLTHSTIFGQPLESGSSIMSCNRRHWSDGLEQSDDPGTLMPEEILVLAGNRAIFPGLVFDPAIHGTLVLGPEA